MGAVGRAEPRLCQQALSCSLGSASPPSGNRVKFLMTWSRETSVSKREGLFIGFCRGKFGDELLVWC